MLPSLDHQETLELKSHVTVIALLLPTLQSRIQQGCFAVEFDSRIFKKYPQDKSIAET